MYSRSERDTTFKASACTSDKVGPGSYSVLPARKFIPAAAPFSSNSRRAFEEPPSDFTPPGPASYTDAATDINDVSPRSRQQYSSKSSSSFASGTARFQDDKEVAQKPGPGSYKVTPPWIHNTQGTPPASASGQRTAASQRVASLLGPAAGASAAVAVKAVQEAKSTAAVPLLTPPSIPARHQSYGYEDGPGGVLLMQPPPTQQQPPPAAVGSATGKAAVRQGSNAASAAAVSSSRGTAWAASKTSRWLNSPKQQQQQQQSQRRPVSSSYDSSERCLTTRFRLGPDGHLSPCRVASTAPGGSSSTSGSAAFRSTVARSHQQEPDPDKVLPGPGSYQITSGLNRPRSAPQPAAAASGFKPAHSVPAAHQQLFGRTSGRSSAVGWGPGVTARSAVGPGVGPGSYETTAAGGAIRSSSNSVLARYPALKAAAAAASSNSSSYSAAASSSRHQLSNRLARDSSVAAAGGGGGFGSTKSRFESPKVQSPGPGKYAADRVVSLSAESARRAAAASKRGAFGSASNRITLTAATAGSSSPGILAPMTGDAAGGGGGGAAAAAAVGPGCYDVDVGVARRAATAAARPSPGFVSRVKRFESFSSTASPSAPDYSCWNGDPASLRGDAARLGPGAYMKLADWSHSSGGSTATSGGRHQAYHVAPFGSESGRSRLATTAAANNNTPGPGAYDSASVNMKEVFRPLSVPATNRAGFSGSARRFAASTSVAPGPGAYTADVASTCTMMKPTYNVTLE